MQSSTAMNTISITALFAGIVPFPVAAAIALGAEVGTTVSALLAAQSGRRIKLQAALTQLLFNLIAALVCGLGLYYIIDFATLIVDPAQNAPLALALLITLYNLITALLVSPRIRPYTVRMQKILPDSHHIITRRTSFLDPTDASHQTIHTLNRDITHFFRLIIDFLDHTIGSTNTKRDTNRITQTTAESLFENYHDIKTRHDQLLKFARRIPTHDLAREDEKQLRQLIDATTGIMMAAKYTKDIMIDLIQLHQTKHPFLQEQHSYLRKQTERIHGEMMYFLTDHSAGIDGINHIIDLINQRNAKTDTIHALLGDASDIDDDLISSQMNIFHHLQDSHHQLILALLNLTLHTTNPNGLHRIRK